MTKPQVTIRPEVFPPTYGYFPMHIDGIFYCPYEIDTKFKEFHKDIADSPIKVQSYWTLYVLARQCLRLPGSFFECGVYSGGSASFLARVMEGSSKKLHLFDTWTGMPEVNPAHDLHETGDFSEVSLDAVKEQVGHEDFVVYHQGKMPETFPGINESIAFAHVDVDIYQSTLDCCRYIYPRLVKGGVMVFDDYGQVTCPGCRLAVDEFFSDKPEIPLLMMNSPAMIFKL